MTGQKWANNRAKRFSNPLEKGGIMPTAACGINCDVCRLKILGICSSCGPGTSQEAIDKIEVQKHLFGQPCPVLACAHMNHIQFCLRDCESFPCENFQAGPYPFSEGYLNMQERRRKQKIEKKKPVGDRFLIPPEHWEDLKEKDPDNLCKNALARPHPPGGLIVCFLQEDVLVDMESRCIQRLDQGRWVKINHSLVELLVLVYLLNVTSHPLSQEMVSVNDLKTAHFFQGPHALKIAPLVERYGNDLRGFTKAAENLGGEPLDLADAAYRFFPFPKIPLYYLLWEGDEEFKPHLSILFDRSIERHLSADAIWGLVNLVSDALRTGHESFFKQ